MKTIVLFFLTICISACAPENPYIGTHIYGYSGDVSLLYSGAEDGGAVPSQISVELEKPHHLYSEVSVLEANSLINLISESLLKGTRKIGCDNSDADMPEGFVHTVVFCGKLNFEDSKVRVYADTIIFDNSDIKVIARDDEYQTLSPSFLAKSKIVVLGNSQITLQGKSHADGGLGVPPNLVMGASSFTGDGHMKIISKAKFTIYGK